MADEATTEVLDTPPAEVQPVAPPPEPAPPDPLAQEREARAMLAGEVAALRAQVQTLAAPKPWAAPAADQTPAQQAEAIERAYRDGKITEADRIFRLGRLAAREESREGWAVARDQRLREDFNALLAKHPSLRTPGSPELIRVNAELDRLESYGYDRNAIATQFQAAQLVVGTGGAMTRRETERRGVPVGGGAPSGSGIPGPNRSDPLRGITAEAIETYKRFGGRLDTAEQKQAYADKYWSHRTRAGQRPK